MNRLVLTILCLLGTTALISQTALYQIIHETKSKSIEFQTADLFSLTGNVAQQAKLQNALTNGHLFTMDPSDLKNLSQRSPEALSITLQRGDSQKPITLELVQQELFGNDFRVLSDKSPNASIKHTKGTHYRGVVAGEANSAVAFSVFEDEVMSVIYARSTGNMVLGKTQKSENEYILYKTEDVLDKPDFDCGTESLPVRPGQLDQVIDLANTAGRVNNCVNIYLEADYDLVVEKGGTAGAINFVTGLFNVVATLYQNEDITLNISDLFLWTSQDPYDQGSSSGALTSFRNYRRNYNGDLAHLISRGAPSGGGIAWVNALCTDYGYAYSYVFDWYNELPSFSWSVNVIAHELGHNLGSPHTHACAWNGNNTPIDGCGSAAGYSEGCDGPLPTDGGTIMSYCHLFSGVGINWEKGLGQQPGDRIRAMINNASCLSSCNEPAPCHTITIQKTNATCNGESDGTAFVTIEGGTAPFTTAWSNGQNSNSISSLSANDYTVTVTDATGCEATDNIEVVEPTALQLSAAVTNETLLKSDDGSINLTVTGGTPPYAYEWSDGSSTEDINGLGSGDYEVTVTDGTACSNTLQANVSYDAVCPTIYIDFMNPTCSDSNDGWAKVDIFDGTPPFQITWSNGITDSMILELGAGNYIVTVTDANDCQRVDQVILETPAALLVAGQIQDESASGFADGQINLSVTGGAMPYTFEWSNGMTTQNVTNLPFGEYEVFVTDANACTASFKANVEAAAAAACHTLSLTTNDVTCNGNNNGTATLSIENGTAPFTIQWSNDANTEQITDLTAGTYSVTVTDANGCITSEQVIINEPSSLEVNGIVTNESLAQNSDGSITLEVTGGTMPYAYNWSNGATTADPNNLPSGEYEVQVTDANGCTATYATKVEAGVTCPTIALSTSDVDCNGGNNGIATLSIENGTAPFAIQWSNGSTDLRNVGLSAGTYSVTVTDANNCSETSQFEINEPMKLEITGTVINESAAQSEDGSIILEVIGGTPPYFYTWSNGAMTADLNNLPFGEYVLLVSDANGCRETFRAEIEEGYTCPTLLTTVADVTCFGGEDGAVQLTVENGTPPFRYEWSNGATTADLNNLPFGEYSLAVIDANDCMIQTTVFIDQPNEITLQATTTNESLSGAGDGSISVEIEGGVAPYSLQWSNGSTDAQLNNLPFGEYNLIATDANGCQATLTETIEAGANCPTLSYQKVDNSCFGESQGSIQLELESGTAPFTFEWSNGATTGDLSNLPKGRYTVEVTDANGCFLVETIDITQPDELKLELFWADVSQAGGNDGFADLKVVGGTAPYSILWSNAKREESIDGLMAGTYGVTATDANGCQIEETIQIQEPSSDVCKEANSLPYTQSFEEGLSDWVDQRAADGKKQFWYTRQGRTPTKRTGPFKAFDGDKYAHVEVNGNIRKRGGLVSPCIDLSGAIAPKLKFKYHLFGRNMGVLGVQISVDDGENFTTVWRRGGDKGYSWRGASVDLSYYANQTIKVRFVGVTRSGPRGDMAIDMVEVIDAGSTLPTFVESSGTLNLLGLEVYPNPILDWTTFEFETNTGGTIHLTIIDMNGKPVREETIKGVVGLNHYELDLSDLEGGLYGIRISDGKEIKTQKLIKARW